MNFKILSEFDFLTLYLPALKKALNQIDQDIYSLPENFLSDEEDLALMKFRDNYRGSLTSWLLLIDSFFDSVSHGFDRVNDDLTVDAAKKKILDSLRSYPPIFDADNGTY